MIYGASRASARIPHSVACLDILSPVDVSHQLPICEYHRLYPTIHTRIRTYIDYLHTYHTSYIPYIISYLLVLSPSPAGPNAHGNPGSPHLSSRPPQSRPVTSPPVWHTCAASPPTTLTPNRSVPIGSRWGLGSAYRPHRLIGVTQRSA